MIFHLYFPSLDAAIKSVTVRYKDREIPFLNELEYVNGEVWANIWMVR